MDKLKAKYSATDFEETLTEDRKRGYEHYCAWLPTARETRKEQQRLTKIATAGDRLHANPDDYFRKSQHEPPVLHDMFPEDIAWTITEISFNDQIPVEIVMNSVIGSLAVAAQGLADVCWNNDQLSAPLSMFCLTAANPSDRKSTCDKYFREPFELYYREQLAEYDEKVKEFKHRESQHQASQLMFKSDYDDAVKQLNKLKHSKNTTDEQIENATKALHEAERVWKTYTESCIEPQPPQSVFNMIMSGRGTVQGVAREFALYPNRGIIDSEAGTLFGGHSMKPETAMHTMATYNGLWDGGGTDNKLADLKNSMPETHGRFSISLMIQPGVLDSFFSDSSGGLSKSIGFLNRFLFCRAESLAGDRLLNDETPPMFYPYLWEHNVKVKAMLDKTDSSLFLDSGVAPVLPKIRVTGMAHVEWVNLYNEFEIQQGKAMPLEGNAHAGRAGELAARLAGLFHLYRHGGDVNAGDDDECLGEINWDDMHYACNTVRWFIKASIVASESTKNLLVVCYSTGY